MDRFLGMMPSNEIEKTVTFKDMLNLKIRIEVGPNGWTIIWADGGTNYKDESIGTEANYKNVLECLHKHFPEDELIEISEIDHHFAIDPEEGIDGGEETLDDEDEKSCCSYSYFDGEDDDDENDDGMEYD